MCRIFSEIDPASYVCQTRSVRLAGHATSIRLESAYWAVLEEISAKQGVSLGRFLTKLHDEVLLLRGDVGNFASLLRCACLTYASEIRGNAGAERSLEAAARRAFGGAPGGVQAVHAKVA